MYNRMSHQISEIISKFNLKYFTREHRNDLEKISDVALDACLLWFDLQVSEVAVCQLFVLTIALNFMICYS